MNESQVREHVRKLRRFYTDVLLYVIINLGLILIWAISGGGYFWPIWVIIGWGIWLGIHAFSLGLIPQMNAMVPFLTAEWEDQQVRRLLEADYKRKSQGEEAPKKTKRQSSKSLNIPSETPKAKPKLTKAKASTTSKARRMPQSKTEA